MLACGGAALYASIFGLPAVPFQRGTLAGMRLFEIVKKDCPKNVSDSATNFTLNALSVAGPGLEEV